MPKRSPQNPEDKALPDHIDIDQRIGDNYGTVFGYVEGNVTLNQTVQQHAFYRVFQAPLLPAYFVERPEPLEVVKASLLSERAPNTLVVSAIHGLGGIGKSVLAAAIAHDATIRDRYADGILWVTLGQEPDLLGLVTGWIHAIGDYAYKPIGTNSLNAATGYLRSRLQDRRVLLVVDDVWDSAHVAPFQVGGAGSTVLVTTRRSDIADDLGAALHELELMTPEQAIQVFEKRLGRCLSVLEQPEALALAEATGYLPLALDLVSAQMAKGKGWQELTVALKQEVADLESLESSPRRRRQGVLKLEACFNLSLNPLRDEFPEVWESFVWLGVLPEDVAITALMVANVWDVPVAEAAERLELLWNEALLRQGTEQYVSGQSWQTYRIHDLLHDIAQRQIELAQALGPGATLVQAHEQLLARYQARTQSGLWHTIPNDGYIHAHLTWHFEKAQQAETIHELLREETPEGLNGWFFACEKVGQTASFIGTVKRAWHLAEECVADEALSPLEQEIDIGLQIRYLLITVSIKHLAQIPLELLLALVNNQIWTPEQGLAYALQMTDPIQCLSKLANYLDEKLRDSMLPQVLEMATDIQNEPSRAKALRALADRLPDALPQALQAAMAIQDERERALTLRMLAYKLPDVLLPQALQAAMAIQDDSERARALRVLANKLPDVLPQALQAATAIQDERKRARALSALADKLPDALLPQALQAATAIQDDSERARALSALADKLPDVLPQALQAATAIQDERERAEALWGLANKFPDVLPQVLHAATAIQDDWERAEALTALADKFPDVLPQALHAATAIQDERERTWALRVLANKLPDALTPQVLQVVAAIQDERERAEALRMLANNLPDALLPQALQVATAIQDEQERAWALTALADKFPDVLPQVLQAATTIQDGRYRAEALTALADKLPETLLPQALQAATEIQDKRFSAQAFTALADKFPEVLPKALQVVTAIQYDPDRARALTVLADKLPDVLLPQVLHAATAIQDDSDRAWALRALADKFPDVLPQALQAATAIQDDSKRARALSALANKFPNVLPQALQAATAIQDDSERARALTILASKLPNMLPQALQAAMAIQNEKYRELALRWLAYQFPDVLPQALQAAAAIQNEKDRAWALRVLARKFPDVLPQALQAATAIQDDWERAEALQSLAQEQKVIDSKRFSKILRILAILPRPVVLKVIAPLVRLISLQEEQKVLRDTVQAIDDICRWWP